MLTWLVGIGFIFGLSISLLAVRTDNFLPRYSEDLMRDLQSQWHSYYNGSSDNNGRENGVRVAGDVHDAHDHSELEDAAGPVTEVVFHSQDEEAHRGEDKVAASLAEEVKVLCWIMTGPLNHDSKVRVYISV